MAKAKPGRALEHFETVATSYARPSSTQLDLINGPCLSAPGDSNVAAALRTSSFVPLEILHVI